MLNVKPQNNLNRFENRVADINQTIKSSVQDVLGDINTVMVNGVFTDANKTFADAGVEDGSTVFVSSVTPAKNA